MGFVFQNITQLAGFLIEGAGKTQRDVSGTGFKGEPETVDFQAILESMTAPESQSGKIEPNESSNDLNYLSALLNSTFGNFVGAVAQPNAGIETKERAGVNADILKVLASNQKDTVTLNLTGSALLSLNSQAKPALSKEVSTSPDLISDLKAANPTGIVGLSFNIKDLLSPNPDGNAGSLNKILDLSTGQDNTNYQIPISLQDSSGIQQTGTVGVGDLLNMLKEFPDAINMEISDLGDSIIIPDTGTSLDSQSSLSTFKFDLRDLLNANAQDKVNGILTTSGKPMVVAKSVSKEAGIQLGEKPILDQRGRANFTVLADKYESVKTPILFDPPSMKPNAQKGNDKLGDFPVASPNEDGEPTQPISEWPGVNAQVLKDLNTSDPKDEMGFASKKYSANNNKTQPERVVSEKSANYSNREIQPEITGEESHKDGKAISRSNLKIQPEIKQNNGQPNTTEPILAIDANPTDIDTQFEATANATERIPIDREQIAANVREMKNTIMEAFGQKIGLVRMKLHPDHLGEISIRLLWKDNGLTVAMKADNKESNKILAAGAADLKGSLEAANFRVNEVNVSTQSDWDGKNLQAGGQDLTSDQKHSRQQRESSNDSMTKDSGNWDSDKTPQNATTRQKANGWVDLTA